MQQNDTLEPMPRTSSVDRLSMVVYRKICGELAQLSRRWWSRRPKGISINKEVLNNCVSGSVQQVDESLLAGGFTIRSKVTKGYFFGEARTAI